MHPIVSESIATARVRELQARAERRRAIDRARATAGLPAPRREIRPRQRLAGALLSAANRLDPTASAARPAPHA